MEVFSIKKTTPHFTRIFGNFKSKIGDERRLAMAPNGGGFGLVLPSFQMGLSRRDTSFIIKQNSGNTKPNLLLTNSHRSHFFATLHSGLIRKNK